MEIPPPWLQLPEVVLDCVFSHLEDPNDLLNAMRTCTNWERVLNPRKQAILFANALPFISKYVNDLDLPNGLLPYRTLCKNVKASVDNCVEFSAKAQVACLNGVKNSINNSLFANCYVFESPYDIEEFMSKMEGHLGNPFIGRYITISLDQQYVFQEMFERVVEMLTRFGKEVKEITLNFQYSSTTLEIITRFQTLLSLVPNIHCLKTNWNSVMSDSSGISISSLSEQIAKTFPALKSLSCLNCTLSKDSISVLFGNVLIIAYGPQLSKLIADGETLRHLAWQPLNKSLANLKMAQIKLPTRYAFDVLEGMKWRLECLRFTHTRNDFVGVLNNFRSTLVHLDIDFQVRWRWQGLQRGPRWHEPLPNLKVFKTKFENTHRVWFCEMIPVKFPNLIYLEFTIRSDEAGLYRMNELDVEARREFMQLEVLAEQNDWFELLPKLEKIKFVIDPAWDPYLIGSVVVHRQ